MPTIYEVQAPDGRILEIEGPDNAPQDQIMLAAQDIYSRMQSEASQTSPVETQQQPAEEESGFTLADFGEGAKEYGKSIVRGFGSGLLSAGSGLAELADVATDRLGLEDLIDSGDESELIRLANYG